MTKVAESTDNPYNYNIRSWRCESCDKNFSSVFSWLREQEDVCPSCGTKLTFVKEKSR